MVAVSCFGALLAIIETIRWYRLGIRDIRCGYFLISRVVFITLKEEEEKDNENTENLDENMSQIVYWKQDEEKMNVLYVLKAY